VLLTFLKLLLSSENYRLGIGIRDPGSGKNLSRIRIQESKKHQISDPGLEHWSQQNELTAFPGGEYSKKSVWDAVVENAKSRPHVDCEHLEGEQFIKAVAE